jgi:hypothetical protein
MWIVRRNGRASRQDSAAPRSEFAATARTIRNRRCKILDFCGDAAAVSKQRLRSLRAPQSRSAFARSRRAPAIIPTFKRAQLHVEPMQRRHNAKGADLHRAIWLPGEEENAAPAYGRIKAMIDFGCVEGTNAYDQTAGFHE